MSAQNGTKQKNTVSEDVLGLFLETGLQFLTGVYVFLILCVLPLYFTDGYAHMGRDKYAFFYQVTTKAGFLFVLLLGIWWGRIFLTCRKRAGADNETSVPDQEAANTKETKVLSLTDKFALGYAGAVLLSYFFSPYREGGIHADAWFGTQGWFMGACSQLFFVGIYFAVSRFWKAGKWQPLFWMTVTFGVFLLGVCNRFGVYPIPMYGAGPEFISTIGNINWYCSYLVPVLFAGVYYSWGVKCAHKRAKVVFLLWLTVGFGAILTQGSLSGVLTLAIMLMVLYACSVHSVQKMENFAECLICLGVASTFIYVLRLSWGESYNYPDMIIDLLTNTPLALFPLVLGIIGRILLQKSGVQYRSYEKHLVRTGYVVYGAAGLAVLLYIILATINTLYPGSLGALSELSFFIFDGAWGSNRGILWTVGWNSFLEQDFWGKVVGIGPDTMVEYISHDLCPDLQAAVQEFFGNFRLTNAHNEWLTMLVNEGILGLVMYAGLLISAVVRMRKGIMDKPDMRKEDSGAVIAGACGMAVLAYVINSMFSFQQVVGTATLFVILGIGEAALRKE